MRSQLHLWGSLVLAGCATTASADETSVAQAFERLGAIVHRDDSKPNRPVIALRFGLRNPIPETIPEVDMDDLRLYVFSFHVTRVTNGNQKNGDRPLPPFAPTAVKVTDADLKDLNQLVNLQELDLSYGEITNQALEYIKDLKHLQILDLRQTPINDAGLAMLENLTSLRKLYLTHCKLLDKGLVHLRKLGNLEVLVLGGYQGGPNGAGQTEITDEGVRELKELIKLQRLYLKWIKVTDAGVKELRNLTNLRELTFQDNDKITDTALETIKDFPKLEVLCLFHTKVTDAGLKHLSGLQQLQLLHLGDTEVTDEGMKALRALPNLRRLDLGGTRVTDRGMEELVELPQLERLSIYRTKVTDKGLKELTKLQNLKRLDLAQTHVTAAGQDEIKAALPKLEFGWIAQYPDWYEKYQRFGIQQFSPNLAALPYSPDGHLAWKQFEASQKSGESSWPGWWCSVPVVLLILAGAGGGLRHRRPAE
jgi:hypothetical protein